MSETAALPRHILIPIRARLALWYSLLLAFVLVLFSLLLYSTLSANLLAEVDNSLRDRAQQIISQSGFDPRKAAIVFPRDLLASDMFVQIADQDGEVRRVSDNLGDLRLPLDADTMARVTPVENRYETDVLADQRLRVYSAPVIFQGTPIGAIQVARLLKPIDETIANLGRLLALGSFLALIAALGLGWLISGQALRPLNRVSRTAEEIGHARDFSRRVPYVGPADEVGRLAATFNGMLDRLEGAYAEAQDAARRLEAALAAQKRFVGDASHELRTPLTAIRGNAELLQRVPDMTACDRQESVAEIAREAQRMSRLVGDLLELARADAGHHLRKEPVAVGPLVHEAWATARHLPGGASLVLIEPIAEATVLGDADYLKQLLLTLLDNARKYTPPDGHIELRSTADAAGVEIAVADTGTGIYPDDLPHIFDRFYRADRARAAGGTGLGLSIAGWIVEEHGGQIRVQSAPDIGSTFTILLPVAQTLTEF